MALWSQGRVVALLADPISMQTIKKIAEGRLKYGSPLALLVLSRINIKFVAQICRSLTGLSGKLTVLSLL